MWIPLHVHSQFSILDASASVDKIAAKAKQFGMPSVALTDHGNMHGAVEFYKACQDNRIKALIGCEVYVAPESRFDKKRHPSGRYSFHLGLIAKDEEGYRNLCKLVSIGYLEGFYYFPRIDHEVLQKYAKGLICLSGCMSSRISNEILNGTRESTLEMIKWHHDLFRDDFYIELQRHKMSDQDLQADGIFQESWMQQQYQDYITKQEKINEALVQIAREQNIPLVATNDSHYMEREDWYAHEILLNIQSGEPCEIWEKDSQGVPQFRTPNPKRRTYSTHECYFKSPEQMQELFKDLPDAISNTLKVAEKCTLELDFETKHYPVYIPPTVDSKIVSKEERKKAAEDYLWKLCEEGISKRYTSERLAKVKEVFPDKEPMNVVRERLEYEMSVIVPKGMSDYLLIVWDFINWAKSKNIPVGPGRGSGAGSIVLYLIGITDIEPLRFHLFFERFINPERISYPDIDVDICMDRRGEVIQYTLEKYGKQNVAQIITFGTMKAKMVIRDVGRVLSVPIAKVNEIAKLVPDDLNITLEKALEVDADLNNMYHNDEDAKRIIDIGQKLEGAIRNTGIHAAGLIVCGESLTEHIPVCTAKDSDMPVTQYSMKPAEQVGMLKIDFLGLKTLTAIQYCVNAIKEKTGKEIDWVNMPLEDKSTFDLLNQGKTLGVFQLESGGMQDLARHLHLDRFEEIIAVGALYRPGPMDMIPSFCSRKHGREEIEYDHPALRDILAETYGIMVYQEQVMAIANTLAGFSLGEGDVLRKAMGKKDQAQMAKQREKFREGAVKNGIEEEVAVRIFDKMEKFASYGFNKSHATAYGYLSYVTAYLKANYPSDWMAALMTCDKTDLTKVTKFIRESKVMQIPILPPDINESGIDFVATDTGIRFAMSAIKGVGTGVVEAIIKERGKNGLYKNLYDFIQRIDGHKVGKKVIESLAQAGCFDFTGWSRDALVQSVEPMFETSQKERQEKAAGVMSLFSLMDGEEQKQFETPPDVKRPISKLETLQKEKELLGFYLTGHPMDAFRNVLERLSCVPLRRVESMEHNAIFRTGLIVEAVNIRISQKTQRKFAILVVSDGMVNYELPVWADLFEEKKHLIKENQLLYAVIQVDKESEGIRLSCRWFDDLTQPSEQMVRECDQAYDRAKMISARTAKGNFKKKNKQEVQMAKKVVMTFDADKMRLSHILHLKSCLEKQSGTMPVEIQFTAKGMALGTLVLDSKHGIQSSKDLEKEVEKFSSFLKLTEV